MNISEFLQSSKRKNTNPLGLSAWSRLQDLHQDICAHLNIILPSKMPGISPNSARVCSVRLRWFGSLEYTADLLHLQVMLLDLDNINMGVVS